LGREGARERGEEIQIKEGRKGADVVRTVKERSRFALAGGTAATDAV
jgi:hypothetical protein